MRVADYIIERLYEEQVKHIFMVTGRGILFLSDAVAKHEDIKSICTHHEQSAAFAAMAYAQYNEKIGACLVSTGCASTNAITGLLCAWQDEISCIFISGQNKLNETTRYTKKKIRTYGQQETDIISIVESITKYAVMITDPNDIAYEMDKALCIAQSGKKGPVWVDVPVDVQNMRIEIEDLKKYTFCYEGVEEYIESIPTSYAGINSTKSVETNKSDRIDLYYLTEVLSDTLLKDSVLITDSGLTELIVSTTVKLKEGQKHLHPISQGSMGYALPAAIGAYYSSGKDIVVVVGDGSIMMNLQELQTISYNKIPIKILVINNNMYATIRNRQNFLFRNRTIGTDSSNGVNCPNFKKVAECFNISYNKIESNLDLVNDLQNILSKEGSILCEIMAVENQQYSH